MKFPNIDPVALSVGPLEIRWYALAYIAGLVIGWLYIRLLNNHSPRPLTQKAYDDLMVWLVAGILLGGRLGYVLFYNFDYYLSNPQDILAVWKGGMSFHGGLIGVIVALALMARTYKLNTLSLFDMVACAAPIGIFFGRIANFINGELYGRPTDAPWGMIFPYSDGLSRHPSQLYEAALEGILLFFILMIAAFGAKMIKAPGRLSGMFLCCYAIARIVVEFFREPDVQIGFLWQSVTMGQLLCVPMFLLGLVLIAKSKKLRTHEDHV